MALPGRDKTFALENCRDLLNKLGREIERFKSDPTDIEARVDFAFNNVVTAWHLCDQVNADLTPPVMAEEPEPQVRSTPEIPHEKEHRCANSSRRSSS